MGCRGDAVGCRMVPLDCHLAMLLAMTTGETYARASLAWLGPAPPWAKARFAPPLPVAASVILPSVTPLLAGFETDTEAKGAILVAGGAEVGAPGGAQVRPGAAPGATAKNSGRT